MAEAGLAVERLRSFIERIERLEEERAGIAADIREVYSEAKGAGFDTKIMRQVVRLRKMDDNDRQEQEMVLDTYLHALGMADAPPGVTSNRPTPSPRKARSAYPGPRLLAADGSRIKSGTAGTRFAAARALRTSPPRGGARSPRSRRCGSGGGCGDKSPRSRRDPAFRRRRAPRPGHRRAFGCRRR